jgi:dTDP-4-dehydrorhamnose 3,5-epimerase
MLIEQDHSCAGTRQQIRGPGTEHSRADYCHIIAAGHVVGIIADRERGDTIARRYNRRMSDSVGASSARIKVVGTRDIQTVGRDGKHAILPRIAGVEILELGNVLTRSGSMTELFRKDWVKIGIVPQQVNWNQLNPHGVTDWHRHTRQSDHLAAVGGNIKLAMWDGREGSTTYGASEIVRMGALRPVLVIVPAGVWHGLRNECGEPAGYLNIIDQLYDYENPDNWRLAPNAAGIPDIL